MADLIAAVQAATAGCAAVPARQAMRVRRLAASAVRTTPAGRSASASSGTSATPSPAATRASTVAKSSARCRIRGLKPAAWHSRSVISWHSVPGLAAIQGSSAHRLMTSAGPAGSGPADATKIVSASSGRSSSAGSGSAGT